MKHMHKFLFGRQLVGYYVGELLRIFLPMFELEASVPRGIVLLSTDQASLIWLHT